MKNCITIYKRDVGAILKNYAALVVVLALCILPSLYAWFNIKASWDPYSAEATRGVRIGVVNEDKGAVLEGQTINIGDTVIEELKKNTQLGWEFVNKETAYEGLKLGKYYATITIPTDFSKDLTSIVGEHTIKGEIIYRVNEKLNAIAPKLTDKGVSTLESMISKEVVETVSRVIFGVGKEIGVDLEAEMPAFTRVYNQLISVQGKFKEINETVTLAEEGVGKFQTLINEMDEALPHLYDTIQQAKALIDSVEQFITTFKTEVNGIGPTIKEDIQIIGSIAGDINESVQAIKEAVESKSEQAYALVNALQKKVEGLHRLVTSLNKLLTAFNRLQANQKLEAIIGRLEVISAPLGEVNEALKQVSESGDIVPQKLNAILDRTLTVTEDVMSLSTHLYENFDKEIQGNLVSIFNKALEVASETLVVLNNAQGALPEVKDLLQTARMASGKGEESITYIKEILPKAEGMIDTLVEKLGTIQDTGDLEKVVELLKADVTARSSFLAAPLEIKEEIIYPMGNYGTSMTPFYTVLCLWVGGLLLASILTVEVKGEYTPNEVYMGKLLLFATIGSIQALIVSLGDLYLLDIYCKSKVLFVVSNVFVGIVFCTLIYSLVSVFGNIGKVIAIILLVLQVAGSGGTFPVQLTPKFFQIINPFLPFTYGISLNREAIGGVVQLIYTRSFSILVLYSILAIGIAILLKKPINQLLEKSIEKFKESGIGE